MNDHTKALIAVGASVAANCRPCLEHHTERARQAGASEDDIAAAAAIGLGVNEGAARQTREFVSTTLGERDPVGAGAAKAGCC